MDAINWPIFCTSGDSPQAFVACWERCYSFDKERGDFYQTNRDLPLTDEQIMNWFVWKNGGPLAAKKKQTVRRNFTAKGVSATPPSEDELSAFLNGPGGAVWRIFWLHLQHPRFPIYDQHVHRAMAFLKTGKCHEIPGHNPTKIETYLESYRQFFARFAGIPPRRVDRALWSFGRFLKSSYGVLLTSPAA